jgi:DNA mismatch repair protein MutS2
VRPRGTVPAPAPLANLQHGAVTMRPRDLQALEFDQVTQHVADFARSAPGKELCRGLQPSCDAATVSAQLDTTWQCFRLLELEGDIPVGEFPDIRVTLRAAAHEGFVLEGKALVDIRSVLGAAAVARAFLRQHRHTYPALADYPERLVPLAELQRSLTRALDDGGGVTDDASDELAAVRRTLRQLRDQLTRRLDRLLERPAMADVIADRYVTVRNGRFVVPIKSNAASQVEGVVQDRSVSGETMFVEPLFAVEMNNRLLLAAKEEEALVRRVLADLTEMVRAVREPLEGLFAGLAEIDSLAARARFARRYRCTQPQMDAEAIDLRQARHPVLLFSGRPVVPIDLLVPAGRRIFVITGPNTGGKTVALKTLGLLALMAQSGLLLPVAEGSGLPCFGGVYADVGDEQSIARNLSTFSAHVANLTEIIESHKPPALVLLDEPGVGTDPEEGAALGIGMLRTFADLGVQVVVSTHYASIKVFALSDDRCVTAAVDFDIEALQPRYRLLYDSVGESMALPIARRLGLPETVLQTAQAACSEQTRALAAAMRELETSRRRYEERAAEAATQLRDTRVARQEADALLAELRSKRQRLWAEELDAARGFVRQLREEGRELLAAVERRDADRAAFRRVVERQESAIRARETESAMPAAAASIAPEMPRVGDQVEVGAQGVRGELLAIDGSRAWIQRGSLRFEVPAADLRRLETTPRTAVTLHVAPAPEETALEISLIGLRAREAVAALDEFLDRAVRARHPSVRIIHGIGSGTLRRAVQDYLATSSYCSSYRTGEAQSGNPGVTVVELAS